MNRIPRRKRFTAWAKKLGVEESLNRAIAEVGA